MSQSGFTPLYRIIATDEHICSLAFRCLAESGVSREVLQNLQSEDDLKALIVAKAREIA